METIPSDGVVPQVVERTCCRISSSCNTVVSEPTAHTSDGGPAAIDIVFHFLSTSEMKKSAIADCVFAVGVNRAKDGPFFSARKTKRLELCQTIEAQTDFL
jgi:hypothetical protein